MALSCEMKAFLTKYIGRAFAGEMARQNHAAHAFFVGGRAAACREIIIIFGGPAEVLVAAKFKGAFPGRLKMARLYKHGDLYKSAPRGGI